MIFGKPFSQQGGVRFGFSIFAIAAYHFRNSHFAEFHFRNRAHQFSQLNFHSYVYQTREQKGKIGQGQEARWQGVPRIPLPS